jgi:hypothetical protein
MSTNLSNEKPGPITWLATNRAAAAVVLVVVGIAVAVLPTLLASWYGTEFVGTIFFTGLLALLLIGVGVVLRFMPPDAADPDRLRILLLSLGAIGGLLVTATGVALTYHWWELLISWLRSGAREGAGRILLSLAVMLVGMAILFISLQLARAEERTHAGLRRLVYGYNAVFTGVLLLMILAVVNVLVDVKYAGALDATSSREFSISERTGNLISNLDKPLHLYVIWPQDQPDLTPLKALLNGFEERSREVTVTYLSPTYDTEKLIDLIQKFPRKIERVELGVLVVLGDEKPENATFIRRNELFESDFEGNVLKFKAEDALAAAITNLAGGPKGKVIVYITQGLGEPDLGDNQPREVDKGLGVLRERLTNRGGYDVRPLRYNPAAPKIPDDCAILVVSNPKSPVEPKFVDSLRDYMITRKGKAVVLVDTPPAGGTETSLPPTGLEGLLSEFNVDVTPSFVLTEQIQDLGGGRGSIENPRQITVVAADAALQSNNTLARGFSMEAFIFLSCRIVRPAMPPRNPLLRAEALLTTKPGAAVWAETNPQTNPITVIRRINTNEDERKKVLSPEPLPVAVSVSESGTPPGMPAHPATSSKPRLVVFGDATFVTNPLASARSGTQNFSLFASTLDWLAERPTSIGVEPRELSVYRLDPTANRARLLLLPGLLAVMAVLGLGLGVWVVRRR